MLRLIVPKESILLLLAIFAAGCRSTDSASVADSAWNYVASTDYQPPLALPPADVTESPIPAPAVESPTWPGESDVLQFAWTDGAHVNFEKRGKARINDVGVMELAGGSFVAEGIDHRLLEACTRSNELTIEVVLKANNTKQNGPARIVSFSTDHNSRNFTLGQDRKNLTLRLRTAKTGFNGTPPETVLTTMKKEHPMHLVVTYRPGELAAFVDGKEVLRTDDLKGDFSTWQPHHLIFWRRVQRST